MGFLDFLGKAYNVVEKVSAKSGNVMSSMANSTMTNSNLSSILIEPNFSKSYKSRVKASPFNSVTISHLLFQVLMLPQQ